MSICTKLTLVDPSLVCQGVQYGDLLQWFKPPTWSRGGPLELASCTFLPNQRIEQPRWRFTSKSHLKNKSTPECSPSDYYLNTYTTAHPLAQIISSSPCPPTPPHTHTSPSPLYSKTPLPLPPSLQKDPPPSPLQKPPSFPLPHPYTTPPPRNIPPPLPLARTLAPALSALLRDEACTVGSGPCGGGSGICRGRGRL